MTLMSALVATETSAGPPAFRRLRHSRIQTDDGIELAAREVGPISAPLTVIFVHGYCLRMASWGLQMASWGLQMARLEAYWGPTVRLVAYDQRGHGASDPAERDSCTIDQLGRDLQAVLDSVAPDGPVVVVGHSMGAMSIMSHARHHPDMVGSRIVGAALIASAAEGLIKAGLFPGWNWPVLEAYRIAMGSMPRAANCGKSAAVKLLSPVLRRASYGRNPVPRTRSQVSNAMIGATALETVAAFIGSLERHDEMQSLPVLSTIPTLVVGGDLDIATPFKNSTKIAAGLADTELLRVPGAGHMVHLECPDLVTDAIVRLVARIEAHQSSACTARGKEGVA
jgi:pimeloyl-ACP methyl ester carboxylesterase